MSKRYFIRTQQNRSGPTIHDVIDRETGNVVYDTAALSLAEKRCAQLNSNAAAHPGGSNARLKS